jgi:teichuronic acid exporter
MHVEEKAPVSAEDAVPGNSAKRSLPNAKTLARGVLWIAAARWSSQIVAWAVTLYMARVLTDREYGSAGLVAVATSWMFALAELGVGSAMLALRDEGEREAGALHALVVGTTLVGSMLLAIAAFPAAWFVHDDSLVLLLAIGGLAVVAQGLGVVPMALLQLKLDYRAVARIEFARSISNTLAVAVLAFAGARVWSLALGAIIATLVQVALLRHASPVRFVRPVWARVRATLAYARFILLSRMAWNTYINADIVMVSRAVSTAVAGQYQFAWNMATLPGEKLVNVLQAVIAPFFSALSNDVAAMRRYFLLLTEGLALAIFPIFVGIVAVADDAIPLIFGAKWIPSIAPLRLLVLYAMVQGVTSVAMHAATALKLARHTNVANIIALIVLPPAFFLAARNYGLSAVAAVWIVASPCLIARPLQMLLRRVDIRWRDYLLVFSAPTLASVAILLSVWAMRWLPLGHASPAASLSLKILAGAIAYTAVIFGVFPSHLTRLREIRAALRSHGQA